MSFLAGTIFLFPQRTTSQQTPWLVESFLPMHAALILTGVDLVLAILFFVLASRQELGNEAEAINEELDTYNPLIPDGTN